MWDQIGFINSEQNLIEGLGFEEVAKERRRFLELKDKKRKRITEVICWRVNVFVMKEISSHAAIGCFTVKRKWGSKAEGTILSQSTKSILGLD